jgi:hypothetical protein
VRLPQSPLPDRPRRDSLWISWSARTCWSVLQGTVQYELGNLDTAIESHRNAAEVFRSLAARWPLTVALHNLAIVLNAAGDRAAAHVTAAEATALLAEFNDPAATTMRESLQQLS